MTAPISRRHPRAITLPLTLLLVAIAVGFQWYIACSIVNPTTITWQAQALAAGVRIVAIGVPREDLVRWDTVWLSVDDAGVVFAPMRAIGPGCGLADELMWPNGRFQHGPQHVRWRWLGCWW